MKEHGGRTLEEATLRLVITGLCNLVILVLAIQSAGAQGVIDFQTIPANPFPINTLDGQDIFNEYDNGFFGVTFEIVANGNVVGRPTIGEAGEPLTGFTACPDEGGVADSLLPTASVFLQPGSNPSGTVAGVLPPLTGVNRFLTTARPFQLPLGSLRITYTNPVVAASGYIFDVDRRSNGNQEEFQITAYNGMGDPVDTVTITAPLFTIDTFEC
jgi:hypothetical protein